MALSPFGITLAVVALLAVFMGVAFVTGFLTPPGSRGAAGPPASARVVVRSQAASVTFDGPDGWLADDGNGTLRRFDSGSGKFVGRATSTGGRPIALASGFGGIWAADISGSEVSKISPSTARLSMAPVQVAQGPVSIATGEGGVWVASLLSGTVSLLDARTGNVAASAALPDGAVRLTLGDGYVWVTGQSNSLTRVDPRPLGVSLESRSIRVGRGPIGVAFGAGSVWVANAESGTVSRVDPSSLEVTGTFEVPSGSSSGFAGSGSDPTTVAVWNGLVWVGVGQRSALLALNPTTGAEVGSAVGLPGVARDLVVAQGELWATTANPGNVVRLNSN